MSGYQVKMYYTSYEQTQLHYMAWMQTSVISGVITSIPTFHCEGYVKSHLKYTNKF
jgi:hypothetical protein